MLTRANRLTEKSDFERLKSKGKLLPSNSFSFIFFDRNDKETSRFGFVVSKKISAKAVVRNKIKRDLRDAVQQLIPQINTSFDGLFLAKSTIVKKSKDEIAKEVEIVFNKAQTI